MRNYSYKIFRLAFTPITLAMLILVSVVGCKSFEPVNKRDLASQHEANVSVEPAQLLNHLEDPVLEVASLNTHMAEIISSTSSISERDDYSNFYEVRTMLIEENNLNTLNTSEDDYLEKLKAVNRELHNRFDYFELLPQSLFLEGEEYTGDVKFHASYENIDMRNQVGIDFYGNELISTPMKTIMLGKKSISLFDDSIEKGRNFSDSDFIVNKSDQIINVILGAEYMTVYEIGDVISLTLYTKRTDFEVIGFYRANTALAFYQDRLNEYAFDQAIVMPLFDIMIDPIDEHDRYYQEIYYSMKNQGKIKSPGLKDNQYIKFNELVMSFNNEMEINPTIKDDDKEAIFGQLVDDEFQNESYLEVIRVLGEISDEFGISYTTPLLPTYCRLD